MRPAGRLLAALMAAGAAACSSPTPAHLSPDSAVAATASSAGPTTAGELRTSVSPTATSAAPQSTAAASAHTATRVAPARGECSAATPPATLRLVVAGVARTALVAVPGDYDQGLVPVVIALHGYDQQASGFAAYTGLLTAGPAAGAMVVVPQGVGDPPGWNVPDSRVVGPSDVRFLGALLDRLVRTTCADPDRIVLAGLSDGSDMAVTAACALRGRVAGLLLVAASTGPSPRCGPEHVVQVHGTADPVDPYRGRHKDLRRGFGSVKAAGAERAFALWSALDGCRSRSVRTQRDLRTFLAQGCAHGSVELVAVRGGGHTWPGAAPRPQLGRTTRSLDTPRLLDLVLRAIASRPA